MYSVDSAQVFCEWGAHGIRSLRDVVDVFIIVDVLSFSTCVDIAVSRGAVVYPYRYKDSSATEFARSIGATCASLKRSTTEISLSSASLTHIESGAKLVLPSPNGSLLSTLTGEKPTLCGSLRNASAVAFAAQSIGKKIGVIPAGERWEDGSIRFAIEDWLGAGVIISACHGNRTAEADLAARSFTGVSDQLAGCIRLSTSGIELIERGFPEDVDLASAVNVSSTVPMLIDGAYRPQSI